MFIELCNITGASLLNLAVQSEAAAREVAGDDGLELHESSDGTVYLRTGPFSAPSNSCSSSLEASLDVCEVCEVAEELWYDCELLLVT